MEKFIDDINELDLNGTFTYADYLTWRFEQSVELIKGKIFKMSPATSLKHQNISSKLHVEIGIYLRNNPCEL